MSSRPKPDPGSRILINRSRGRKREQAQAADLDVSSYVHVPVHGFRVLRPVNGCELRGPSCNQSIFQQVVRA